MNKKIKIIDLINMQYKKEKMPKNIRIKYSPIFDYYIYNEEIKWYETADKTSILDVFQNLDYEVEILEDNTEEIEELDRELKFNDLVEPYGINEELMWSEIIKQQNKINELEKRVNQLTIKLANTDK